jgi:hypothetical protein
VLLIYESLENPKRIIITMDSNDFNGKYRTSSILLNGMILRHPGIPLKTCCEDSSYSYYGDYILDSTTISPTQYGVPESVDKDTQYMSDHLPVMLITHN